MLSNVLQLKLLKAARLTDLAWLQRLSLAFEGEQAYKALLPSCPRMTLCILCLHRNMDAISTMHQTALGSNLFLRWGGCKDFASACQRYEMKHSVTHDRH